MKFVRALRLLDGSGIGTGVWATRVGGNHGLDSAAHRRNKHWARTIHRAHDDLDGIIYRGRYAGTVCMALFERATDAFLALLEFSAPLSHPALADRIYTAAHELGYTIV
ncbi:RES domain-containing protein [Rhodococcus sp. IEGM 1366]|uniref:RES domain-containing protein n=1 Tax=Rhodococcus sp. IEGM 1366 TaxID=3082223 RepID=UPI00295400C0|nr:RES domain-containing protein [Rhodococcus sp. IEGM 1366]MDV8070945.1 RES domain-containing protein [Rhodococcus sp. IEGM 1366]